MGKIVDVYKEMVDKYLEEKATVVFANSNVSHASYIIQRMLESAEKEVCILSGTFNDVFYQGAEVKKAFQVAAKSIYKNGGSIRVITADEPDTKDLRQLFKEVNESAGGKDVVKYISAINGGKPEDIQHFIVVDKLMYREEERHPLLKEPLEQAKIKAEVCFNAKEKASFLASSFNSIWERLSAH